MIIGINASDLISQHPTGVQRYSEYVIRYLLNYSSDQQFRLYSPETLPAPFDQHQVIVSGQKYWTQLRLPFELWRRRPDVFFQPSYMLPPLRFCPEVVTIHDLAWIKFPDGYSKQQLNLHQTAIARIKKQKAEIIVPSQSTYNDCQKLLGLPNNSLHKIPEALIPLPSPENPLPEDIEKFKDRQIILSIGRLEKRKNQIPLIKAMPIIKKRQPWIDHNLNKAPVLVLIGQKGYMAGDVFKAINEAEGAGAEIKHISSANDQQLANWLSIASVLIYPSLYEGFGLPILQAFSFGVPVLAANNSSIPEVAGQAAQYINEIDNPDSISQTIIEVLYNSDRQKIMVNEGNKQLANFSWEKASAQTLSVLLASKSKEKNEKIPA